MMRRPRLRRLAYAAVLCIAALTTAVAAGPVMAVSRAGPVPRGARQVPVQETDQGSVLAEVDPASTYFAEEHWDKIMQPAEVAPKA